jgi:hypothetical protein
MNDTAPRIAGIGDNQAPAYAQNVTDQLERSYAALSESIETLLARAREAPREVVDDDSAVKVGLIVKELRDADKRAEAFRVSEKEPHLRAENAVDAFFFALREKLARRNPRDRSQKPGAADILQARIDDYLERKRIVEEERRRREAEETARIAREKAAEEARAAKEAEETRLAAERARKPEIAAEKAAVADQAEERASAAKVEAQVAQDAAQQAHIATLAKPAEMSRTRGDGVLLTQAREPYAIVVNRTMIDMEKLRPFFTDAEIEKALRGWARTTGFSIPMQGAEIGFRRKGQTR